MWQVSVKSKGLGSSKNIIGSYRLCLTERALSLVQMSSNDPEIYEFPVSTDGDHFGFFCFLLFFCGSANRYDGHFLFDGHNIIFVIL